MSTKSGRFLATAFVALVVGAGVAVGRWDGPNLPRMAEIVEALRVEEAKYRDIEYLLKITARKVDPAAPRAPGEVTSEETRLVVLQGDKVRLQESSTEQVFGSKLRSEEVSGFDGEKTRTAIAGNSVNVHLGRFEHPDVYPAHSVPLIHYRLNFPLSVYLGGSDAIHSHPKYGRFEKEGNSTAEFAKVEARFDGEEVVDGLPCVRVRVDRWYSSKGGPVLQHLWLCPTRNYLCVKETLSSPSAMFGYLPMHEMRADGLREVSPGLWFPTRVTLDDYDRQALRQKKQQVGSRTETVVERVSLAPSFEDAFFREIPIPVDLPVFTLRDGSLVGSSRPEPVGGAEERAKLDEVVARVREQERRYEALEVEAKVSYRHVGTDRFMGGSITEQSKASCGQSCGGNLAYFTLDPEHHHGERAPSPRVRTSRRSTASGPEASAWTAGTAGREDRQPSGKGVVARPRAVGTASPCSAPTPSSCVTTTFTGRSPICSSLPGTTRSTSTGSDSAIAAKRSSTATRASSSEATC